MITKGNTVAFIFFWLMSQSAIGASWLVCNGSKDIKWGGATTSARINTTSFPVGSVLDSAQRGIDRTNANPSKFVINRTTETGGVGSGNGQNEVYANNISPPGRARMRYHCYWLFGTRAGLDEVDIELDSGDSWSTSQTKSTMRAYGGTGQPIEPVIVHEAGHYLGLMHVTSEYNIMGDSWRHHHTNGPTARSYFGEDGATGAMALYGAQTSEFNDVAVAHWRRTGDDGEYSIHGRTRLLNSSDIELSTVGSTAEPTYMVDLGQSVKAEFTIENNGKSKVSNIKYGIYISTNDTISMSDRRIGGGTYSNINTGFAPAHLFSFVVPRNLSRGSNYWVGIVIDEDNRLSEVSGSNNATYIGFKVN